MNTSPPITLFIHGTLPPEPVLSIPYAQRFFHCPTGLTKLSELNDSHSKDILTSLCNTNPKQFPQEHCYTFGWSGTLHHSARKEAAFDLYKALNGLRKTYKQNSMQPRIHLITHSHGGNVALNLKYPSEKYQADIVIDELILLACPVQLETSQYVKDSLFKEVYSIHSHYDILQIADPQGFHAFLDNIKNFGLEFTFSNLKQLGPLFSERHFPKSPGVKQLNVKYPHRELLHIEFLLPEFIEELPLLIKKMKQHRNSSSDPDDLTHVLGSS